MLSLLATILSGCGYSTRGNIPEHITTVAVPIFKNRTPYGGLEAIITAGVIDAFSGRLRVVPVGQADSLLEGEILSHRRGHRVRSVRHGDRPTA